MPPLVWWSYISPPYGKRKEEKDEKKLLMAAYIGTEVVEVNDVISPFENVYGCQLVLSNHADESTSGYGKEAVKRKLTPT